MIPDDYDGFHADETEVCACAVCYAAMQGENDYPAQSGRELFVSQISYHLFHCRGARHYFQLSHYPEIDQHLLAEAAWHRGALRKLFAYRRSLRQPTAEVSPGN